MIRLLRRKFLFIAMVSLLGTLTVLCGAIGIINHYTTTKRADRAITMLHQNGGQFIPPGDAVDTAAFDFQITPETPFETRYFIVELTPQQEVRSVNLEHIAALDRRTVVDTINKILDTKAQRGYVEHYRFRMFPEADGGSTIIVLDSFLQLQAASNILCISILVSLACAFVVFLLLLGLSKRAVRPFLENSERQKQFVTDASHELKTPLAILSANIGLLEDSHGNNKWLESSKIQIRRLDQLIKNLVELARTEEDIKEEAAVFFSLSDVAEASIDAFQALAEANGKILSANIAEGVMMKGAEDNLFRLCVILLDNAVKYCDPGGTIRIVLVRHGRNVHLSVSNPCSGLDPALLPRYFDRFYRADASRARSTGGYGIGLSTAKAIVERHHGRITNRYAQGTITFTAVIPQAM